MQVKAKVRGLETLSRLNGLVGRVLPVRKREEILAAALRPVVPVMESYAPKRTGASADSIDIEILDGEDAQTATVAIGVGKDGWPLRYSEFGTEHQAAKPAIRPAWESMKEQVLADVRGKVADEFRRLG